MYEKLKIDPDTHEISLIQTISYINSRLEEISRSEKKANVFTELVSLLNYAEYKARLKGNHLPKIRTTLFGLIKDYLGEETWYLSKDMAIEELENHKRLMLNDVTRKIPEYCNHKYNFYVLNAYFPLHNKYMSIGVAEESYYKAAKKIRSRFGEFHLDNKLNFQKFRQRNEPAKNSLEFLVVFKA